MRLQLYQSGLYMLGRPNPNKDLWGKQQPRQKKTPQRTEDPARRRMEERLSSRLARRLSLACLVAAAIAGRNGPNDLREEEVAMLPKPDPSPACASWCSPHFAEHCRPGGGAKRQCDLCPFCSLQEEEASHQPPSPPQCAFFCDAQSAAAHCVDERCTGETPMPRSLR